MPPKLSFVWEQPSNWRNKGSVMKKTIHTQLTITFVALTIIPVLLIAIAVGWQLGIEALLIIGRVILLILFVAIGFGLWQTKNIIEPFQTFIHHAQAISEDNLSKRVPTIKFKELAKLATSFNAMTAQLQEASDTLESSVQRSTRDLRITLEISQQITTIRDIDTLLQHVVDSIQVNYRFYYVSIYLMDEKQSDLVFSVGSGEVGQKLIEQTHRIKVGQGIIGTVAQTEKHYLSNDVEDNVLFTANPLLPETNSELALPMTKNNEFIGVLDIQCRDIDCFKAYQVVLLQSLADQTAMSMENITLFNDMETSLHKVKRLNRRLTGETWDAFTKEEEHVGYRFKGNSHSPIRHDSKTWLRTMTEASMKRRLITTTTNNTVQSAELAIPLILRNEIIGVLGIKRDKHTTWDQEEINVVDTVADQLARALENVRLSKEQEKTILQLREIDRMKSEFMTNVSHELLTPLNAIIGFAELLLMGIDGELSEMAMTDVDAIFSSGKRLLALVNNVLDLSKMGAGLMDLDHNPVDIYQTFQNVHGVNIALVEDKPLEVVVDAEADMPKVWADPSRLTQIINNLVSNGIKFTEKGKVVMGAELLAEDNMMRIYVTDTGIGIPEDNFEMIFEEFQQVDARSNRQFQGAGMGLTIVRNLVEMHGSKIIVESQVGKGSKFHFTLPLYQEDITLILEK